MKTYVLKLALLACAFLAMQASAKITLPSLVSDHMVLQQNSTVKLWGKSDRKIVTVTTSWDKKTFSAPVDKNGEWRVKVVTPKAGGPYVINLTDGEPLKISDVLIGEVWLCAGQSNMEMPVKGSKGQPITNSFQKLMEATSTTPIRMVKVKRATSKTPLDNVEGKWGVCTPQNVANITAVGYFFAQHLHTQLNVPIGIIDNNWGGSKVETWMSEEMLAPFASEMDVTIPEDISKIKSIQRTPIVLFNGMINPIKDYAIKGVIWYQGESNIDNYKQYERLFPAMVQGWRKLWGLGDFPFYYVQISPYNYKGSNKTEAALLREVQAACLKTISNSGMAVVMDAGNQYCIHPEDKQTVGDRLAALALVKTYDIAGISCLSPMYKSHEVKDGKILVTFDNVELGLKAYGKIEGFEIAGKDRKFYPAQAKVLNWSNPVSVWSDSVTTPVAVRYGFKNFPIPVCTLQGGNNLPAAPFRTDSWE